MTDHESNEDLTPKVSQNEITDSEKMSHQDDTPTLTEAGKDAMQGPEHTFVPMPDDVRMDLYRFQNEYPAEQRGRAFGEYFNNSSSSTQELLQMNTHVDGRQTRIFDVKAGEYIIVRDDQEPTANE